MIRIYGKTKAITQYIELPRMLIYMHGNFPILDTLTECGSVFIVTENTSDKMWHSLIEVLEV